MLASARIPFDSKDAPLKINFPFVHKLGGLLAAMSIRAWMSTLEVRSAFYDPSTDPSSRDYSGQKIFVF